MTAEIFLKLIRYSTINKDSSLSKILSYTGPLLTGPIFDGAFISWTYIFFYYIFSFKY